jgi:hypothetical protein
MTITSITTVTMATMIKHPVHQYVTDVMVVTVNLYCYVLPEQGYTCRSRPSLPCPGG